MRAFLPVLVVAFAVSVAPTVARGEPAPYDLAADGSRRAAIAKSELGSPVKTTREGAFVVIGPSGWQDERFEQSVALMRSALAGLANRRFGRGPSQAISVYLFPDGASYQSFCRRKYGAACIARYGFYSPDDRYMVMNIGLGLGTLTHELVHPFVEADFPSAPTWLNEGLASLFEQPRIPKVGEIHGAKNWRHPRLVKALVSGEAATLNRLFGMSDRTFRGTDEDLHYALARYVCQWLDERGHLWAFYQRWRDDVGNDPTGEKAFTAVTGMTPVQAHPLWARWVRTL